MTTEYNERRRDRVAKGWQRNEGVPRKILSSMQQMALQAKEEKQRNGGRHDLRCGAGQKVQKIVSKRWAAQMISTFLSL